MQDLFAYGTLMCTDIMRAVSGCRTPAGRRAVLHDHCRLVVRGEHYPGLLARRGAAVEGVLYRRLPAAAWARLDRFEGAEYLRRGISVELDDGSHRQAEVYLFRPELADRLEDRLWEPQVFLRHGKAAFEAAYRGYAVLAEPGKSGAPVWSRR